MLPPPPAGAVAPTAPTAVAPTPLPISKGAAKFGAVRGDHAVTVPNLNGIDLKNMLVGLWNVAVAQCGSVEKVAELVAAFEATPKSSYPGNKEGRSAFALGNILKTLTKANTVSTAKGERKARQKSSDKFTQAFAMLAKEMGGVDQLKAKLGDQFAALGIEKFLAGVK